MFLDRKIAYPEITEMIEAAMEEVSYIAHPDLEQIYVKDKNRIERTIDRMQFDYKNL